MRWRWLFPLLGALALGVVFALRRGPERARSAEPQAEAHQERAVSSRGPAPELVSPRAASVESVEAPGDDALGRRESVAAAGALVAGRVEVEGGLPAGENVVVVAHAHRAGVSRLHSRAFEAPVALDGSFELRVPEDTRSVELELDSLLLFLSDEVEVRPGTLDVVLRPKVFAAVRGRVHRPLGLDSSASAEDAIHVAVGRSSVYADADGRFELVVGPDEPLELVARSEASEGLETHLEVAALRAGEIRWVEVALEPLLALRGLVTDESDAPLEGASVSLFLPLERRVLDGKPSAAEITGADGSFMLDQLPPGPCDVEVRAPGRRVERRKLVLPDDGRDLLHFVLAPAVTVHGRVVGPDGVARAGAQVRVLGEPRTVLLLSGEFKLEKPLRTDEEGRFTLVLDEPTPRLVASAQGFADSLPLVLEPGMGKEESEIVLSLRPACSLRVRVSSDDGGLVNGVVVFRSEDGTQHFLGVKNGTIEEHDLPPGRAWIEAHPYQLASDSEPTSSGTGALEVELTPEFETRAELRLVRTK